MELLKKACAYYRLSLPNDKTTSDEAKAKAAIIDEGERARLMERLLVGEIVSTKKEEKNKRDRRKVKSKSPHKLGGVTRKKDY
jgi:hypothetical protein